MGDNRTGDGEGDDEEMEIALADVPANVERIAFTVTIYEAEARRQKTEVRGQKAEVRRQGVGGLAKHLHLQTSNPLTL